MVLDPVVLESPCAVTESPPEATAGLGFIPAAWLVLSRDGLTLDEAIVPERSSVLLPVPRGAAAITIGDVRLPIYLEARAALILAFEDREDARLFDRLTQGDHASADHRCS